MDTSRLARIAGLAAACVASAASTGCTFAKTFGGGIDFTGRTLTEEARGERKLAADVQGVLVTALPEKSELLVGDVRPGDVITAVNGRATQDYATFVDAVFTAGSEQPLALTIVRGADRHDATITSGHAMSAATLRFDLLFPFGGRPLERDSQLARDEGFLGVNHDTPPPWETNEPWSAFDLALFDLDFGPDLAGFTLLRSLGWERTPGNWVTRLLCFDFGRATVVDTRHDADHPIWRSAAQLGN